MLVDQSLSEELRGSEGHAVIYADVHADEEDQNLTTYLIFYLTTNQIFHLNTQYTIIVLLLIP